MDRAIFRRRVPQAEFATPAILVANDCGEQVPMAWKWYCIYSSSMIGFAARAALAEDVQEYSRPTRAFIERSSEGAASLEDWSAL